MTTVTMTNEEAAIKAKTGDKTMIEFLWTNNQGLIRNMVYGMTHAGEDCDDMLQDAFFSLSSAIEAFIPESGIKFSTFLVNAIKWKAHRKRAQTKPIGSLVLDSPIKADSDTDLIDTIADPDALDPEAVAEQSDLNRIIEQSLFRLPVLQEQCIRRQYLQGQSISVIAEQTGIQEATARARVTEGLRKLRRNPRLREISDFYCQAYHGTGLACFKRNEYSSVTERLALNHVEAWEKRKIVAAYEQAYLEWYNRGSPEGSEPERPITEVI